MKRTLLCVAVLAFLNSAFAFDDMKPGLLGEVFDLGEPQNEFPIVDASQTPVVKRLDKTIDFASANHFVGTKLSTNCYARWTGKIRIPEEGSYTFSLESKDGSRLYICDRKVVDNEGSHPLQTKSGEVDLPSGYLDITIEYFQNNGPSSCKAFWKSSTIPTEVIPASVLYHSSLPAIAVLPQEPSLTKSISVQTVSSR